MKEKNAHHQTGREKIIPRYDCLLLESCMFQYIVFARTEKKVLQGRKIKGRGKRSFRKKANMDSSIVLFFKTPQNMWVKHFYLIHKSLSTHSVTFLKMQCSMLILKKNYTDTLVNKIEVEMVFLDVSGPLSKQFTEKNHNYWTIKRYSLIFVLSFLLIFIKLTKMLFA